MNRKQEIQRLRRSMDGVLQKHGFGGFAGSFAMRTDSGDYETVICSHVTDHPHKADLKQFVGHQLRIIRADLLTNIKNTDLEGPRDAFILALQSLIEPFTEVTLRLSPKQIESLYDLGIGIVYQPAEAGLDTPTVAVGSEIVRVCRPLLPPDVVAETDRNAVLMRETIDAGSFGSGILAAAKEHIAEEYNERKKAKDQEEHN